MVEAVESPNKLIDIISPAIPQVADRSDAWWIFVSVVVVALLVWVMWRWYYSDRQKSLRELSRLFAAFQTQALSPREVCYWLAAYLKRRLRVHYLSPAVIPSVVLAHERKRWEHFMQRLHEVRYGPQSITEQDIVGLLIEAKFWMRRWP